MAAAVVENPEEVIDLWNLWANFFKGDPMQVIISTVTILGFLLTVFVYVKLRNVNKNLKSGKRVAKYLKEYSEILKIIESRNASKPSDLYKRTEHINLQFFCHVGFTQKRKAQKMFNLVKEDDQTYQMLKNFLTDIMIQFERNAI